MRYHFHLRESQGYVSDEEGLELADLDAVRRAAVAGARSIISSEVMHGKLPLGTVMEVEDEHGEPVFELSFRAAVTLDG
jgi:hypothetical protein